jgi:Lysophospholipase L1 and related esterases
MKNKRLSALVVAGLFLVVSGAGYLYFFRARPIGTGPAGPELSAEMFSGVWSDKPVLLVGLGDSVTAGFGARRGYSYFNLLVTNSATDFQDMRGKCLQAVLPNLIFTNLSESGSTSGEHLRRQLPRLPVVGSNTTALVVITTGGNDLIHNYGRTPPREEAMYGATWEQAEPWIKNFERRLNEMIGVINDHYSAGCEIFLANIFDPTDAVGDIQRAGLPPWKDGIKILTAYNEVIQRCAENHHSVHLVDMHKAFLGHGIHCTQFWSKHYRSNDPRYWYYVNLEDPNERGYDAIRRLFLIEISKVAKQLR